MKIELWAKIKVKDEWQKWRVPVDVSPHDPDDDGSGPQFCVGPTYRLDQAIVPCMFFDLAEMEAVIVAFRSFLCSKAKERT